MSLQEIQTQIVSLPVDEREELAQWFAQLDNDDWDRQMEADAKAGRLDALAAQAIADFEAGRYKKL